MLQIGAATRRINNRPGRPVQGASVDNTARYVRDDCEANALYAASAEGHVLLISCDLVGLERTVLQPVTEQIAAATGLDPAAIVVACTHMHSGPSLLRTNCLKPVDHEYIQLLQQRLVELGTAACAAAAPAALGWGLGRAQLGYNRRCCWQDGSHTMHGDAARPDFTGLEGPDDPAHLALFAVSPAGAPLAVVYHNSTHPTCFYGADFYSADFPGLARQYLRMALGPVPVLFLNGAFGDLSLDDQQRVHRPPEAREQKLMRLAHLAAGETLRLWHQAEFVQEPPVAHAWTELPVGVRLPAAARHTWATGVLQQVAAGQPVRTWDRMFAYGTHLLQEEFGQDPQDRLRLHAVRLGDVALLTQPCELFCQFGLDVKRRSPAGLTGVVGIADGYGGYCPTAYGPLGGGYSGEPLHWSRLEVDAGYRIVDAGAALLHHLWRDGS